MGFFSKQDRNPLTKAQTLDHLIQDRVLGRGRINEVSYFCADLYETIDGEQQFTGVEIVVKGHRGDELHMFTGSEVNHIIQIAAALDLGADYDVYPTDVYTQFYLRPITRQQNTKSYPFSQNINRSLGLSDAYRDTKQDQPKKKKK